MPYSKKRYGTKKEYKKYQSCVKKVKKQEGYNPYAVCRASIYKDKPYSKIEGYASEIQKVIEKDYSSEEIDRRDELREIYLHAQKIGDLSKRLKEAV